MSPPISYHESPNCNSPNSSGGSVFSYSQHLPHQPTQPHHHYDQSFYAEANSEEDELLDVIAKWQDQN